MNTAAARRAPAYTLDGRPASRQAFYAAACDPRRAVVVEACAGAGKTWILVSRIVRALLDGAEPQQILAITFTRKAAGEMRTRLAEWLREFAGLDAAAAAQALVDRGVDPGQAREQATALVGLHERVLASGRSVEVHTFHAWFSQLLRAAPFELLAELGLRPGMALIEDLGELRPALMRRFHAAVLDDPALLADHAALAASRGRTTLQKWLDAAWQRRTEIELADAAGAAEAAVVPAATLFPECAALADPALPQGLARAPALLDEVRSLARRLGVRNKTRSSESAQALSAALERHAGDADDGALFDALWSALFTSGGTPKKQLGELPEQAALCERLERIAAAVAQQQAHDEHGRMLRLSRALFAAYAALKRQRGLIDMADLEQVALALLGDHSLAGWLQQRLDARVRHLLIDEFQDTSPLQWHALHGWLSSYAGAGAGGTPSLFVVGDPKQSIYRFRRAEPRVFAAAQRFVVEGLGGTLAACDHTRRNAPAVLQAVNPVFGRLSEEGALDGWREHSTEVGEGEREGGGVFTLPCVERMKSAAPDQADAPASPAWRNSLTTRRHEPELLLREAEAGFVAQAIAELVQQRGHAPGEIFVLARRRASLRFAAQALRARQLPHAAPEEWSLAALPEVQDLVAVLDVLASPGQSLSLARALKSPLFGASDDDLLALSRAAREAGQARDWWQVLVDGRVASPALERARRLFAGWREAAATLPPHDLLDRVVADGDLIARLAAAVPPERVASAVDAVHALLAASLELDGARYATLYNFVRALRQRPVNAMPTSRSDAVQLLTIHGAKGLEARTVFVMDADPEPTQAETATLLIDWPVESLKPRRVAFVASHARCPPSLRELLASEIAAREREEVNGLYVAMTRARERLTFSRTPPHRAPQQPSWWQRLQDVARRWVPHCEAAAPVPTAHARIVDLAPAAAAAAARLHGAVPGSALARPIDSRESASRVARVGQAVHRALEWAAGSRAATDRAALAAAAAAEFGVADARAVRSIVDRILGSAACAPFFDAAAIGWAGNEVTLAGVGPEAGAVLRIDRLVRTAGPPPCWWVLDYKLDSRPDDDAGLRLQLAAYRRAVQALQPGEPVRAAFVTAGGDVVELG